MKKYLDIHNVRIYNSVLIFEKFIFIILDFELLFKNVKTKLIVKWMNR